jgi:predicted DNA-binding ribbon-helix-helix protein
MTAEHDHLKPYFRTITSEGKRSGFRLERVFWHALDEVIQSEGISAADYLARIRNVKSGDSGLSSFLRASIMHSVLTDQQKAKRKKSEFSSKSIVIACPIPAFVISEQKKILFQNTPFLVYLQTRFVGIDDVSSVKNMQLSIEVPLAELIANLRRDNTRPQLTGFSISYGQRRLPGRLSLTLAADIEESPAAIAFIAGSS